MTYNPEAWLESTTREIKNYVAGGFNAAVLDNNSAPAGLEIYDVVMEFPGPALDDKTMPLTKTIIHFEIDEIRDEPVGLGENVYADNYDAVAHTVNPQYAGKHTINFDLGIWASAESGGTTSRLRAKEILYDLLGSVSGQLAFRAATDGGDGYIEILNYNGGRFIQDLVNDVPVYRMIDAQLTVRVWSRTKLASVAGPSIEEIDQDQSGLTIIG